MIIGMEYNKIMDNRSEKFKGVWNCIKVLKENGEKEFYDGGMMDERCRFFFSILNPISNLRLEKVCI